MRKALLICDTEKKAMYNILFKPIYLSKNQGHGNARRTSIEKCTYNLVALMDADDISLPDRFEKQITKFVAEPDISAVGGQINEFIGTPQNIIYKRDVPLKDFEIKKYLKKRCPMNQVTVMLNKKDYLRSGGYIDWFCVEDYYLWTRMALNNCKFENVPDTLVNVRVGLQMSMRRGGIKYFCSECRLQKYMLENHIINLPQYIYNIAVRFGGEVIATPKMRTKLFSLLRKKYDADNCYKEATKEKRVIKEYPAFSVAMCVYYRDKAEWLKTALESVANQTVKPREIVLVVDGPISAALQNVIKCFQNKCKGEEE